jgi:D-aminopeptidase
VPDLRDLALSIGPYRRGERNSITDVAGVRVGHTTLIRGDGPTVVGSGPVRTGVTVIEPRAASARECPSFAGAVRLNGNGDVTGLEWIRESGLLTTPVALTNTCSVGAVRDALAAYDTRLHGSTGFWPMPVVGETYDGLLNDIHGQHVSATHVEQAIAAYSDEPVIQGNVGGGTGMVCHEFKGGIGSSSRVLDADDGGWTVGVLVQTNYGARPMLRVDGVPVGRLIDDSVVPLPARPSELPDLTPGMGSIIIVVGTDAPLLPEQCRRLAVRAGAGLARVGGSMSDGSGDFAIAFATGNEKIPAEFYPMVEPGAIPRHLPLTHQVTMVTHQQLGPLFAAVSDATEEAIVNALLAAETMTGRDGMTVFALPPDLLVDVMARHRFETP